jgi:hypothetical protein
MWIGAVIVLMVATACASREPGEVPCSWGGKRYISCEYLTLAPIRNAAWLEYCLEQADCTAAAETGLYTHLGPVSAASYPDYDQARLQCAEVTFTQKDGTEKIHKLVIINSDDEQSFEVIDDVELESCVSMSE